METKVLLEGKVPKESLAMMVVVAILVHRLVIQPFLNLINTNIFRDWEDQWVKRDSRELTGLLVVTEKKETWVRLDMQDIPVQIIAHQNILPVCH